MTFSSDYSEREMVVTGEEGKYPQNISLEFVQYNEGAPVPLWRGHEIHARFTGLECSAILRLQ
jgi:hypothetical protein